MEHTDQPLHSSEPSDRLFGNVLRQLRRAAGWTQAELAERANLSLRGIADLERGINRHPRRETVLALAKALELPEETRHRFIAAARGRSPDLSVSDPLLLPTSIAEPPESKGDLFPPPIFPTGTVTFLFTDIEGSTQLLRHLGDRYAAVLSEHQRLLRKAWAEHSGAEWIPRVRASSWPSRLHLPPSPRLLLPPERWPSTPGQRKELYGSGWGCIPAHPS